MLSTVIVLTAIAVTIAFLTLNFFKSKGKKIFKGKLLKNLKKWLLCKQFYKLSESYLVRVRSGNAFIKNVALYYERCYT